MRDIGEDLSVDHAVIRKSAKLLHGITITQPFFEGNKETALASTTAFLTLNGYELQATSQELFSLLTGIVYGTQDLNSIQEFLRSHVKKIT